MVRDVDNVSFSEEVLESTLPVVVDFYAPWNEPSRTMMPSFKELSDVFDGRLKFVTLNTDRNSITAARYGIKKIPTLSVFYQGRLQLVIPDFISKKDFRNRIEEYLYKLDAHPTEVL